MPELPEVETIVRDLSPALIGQKIHKTKFLNVKIREDCTYKNASILAGKIVKHITRRGKNIIFNLTDNLAIVCHLKMTGKLIIEANTNHNKKHLHFFIAFEKFHLNFYDIRKFGRICILKESDLPDHPRLKKLGPEPFDITPEYFAEILKKRNRQVKLVLLDQNTIAGLGNIYADESLYRAGLRPSLKASGISKARLKKLHGSILSVLRFAIENRGTSVDNYLDGFGRQGSFQNLLKVYGKTGKPCPKCGRLFKRIILGGRSTHYCPKCQV